MSHKIKRQARKALLVRVQALAADQRKDREVKALLNYIRTYWRY